MLLNAPAQLPQVKPKISSWIHKRNSKQIQSLTPCSNNSSLTGLAVTSKKTILLPKKPQASFNDTKYLQRLVSYQEENFTKINSSRVRFFPQGTHNSIEIKEIMVYIGQKGKQVQFCKLSDFSTIESPQIRFTEDLQKLLTGNLIADFKTVGWIILQGDEWGFLLDLETIEEARKGNLPSSWKSLVGTEFFWNLFKLESLSSVFRNQYMPLEKYPTSSALTPHQKEDVKWMHNLEQNHTFEIRNDVHPQAIKFFDTGYCLTNFQTKLTKAYHSEGFVQFPGAILNSKTGSGKTASILGLISTRDPREQSLIIVSEERLLQWRQEFNKFAPEIRVLVVSDLSDWDEIAFEFSGQEKSTIISDCDVVLTHRKIFEIKETLPQEIFNVNFKRVVLGDIQEILTRYSKRQGLFEEMRFAQIQYLSQQETLSKKNHVEFLETIKNLQKKFLWGVSPACIPVKVAKAFQDLLDVGLYSYNQATSDEINQTFFELHFRTSLFNAETQSVEIEKSVIKVQPSRIHNFYLNPASAKNLKDEEMIKKIVQTQLADFMAPDDQDNSVSEALEIIHYKQQSDIRKIQTEAKAQNSDVSALNERIEALKGPNSFYAEAAQLLRSPQFECSVCLESHSNEEITMLSCLHHFCEDCYRQFSEAGEVAKCPVCTKFINAQDLIIHPLSRCARENKFTALFKEIQKTSPKDKIVIFAHYHSVLEALAQSLKDFGVSSLVLKGDCNEIFKTLESFRRDSDVKILLMSVKQGKCGISLPEANHVFFAQPSFEANRKKAALVYDQCVGRVLRMGQSKKVNVKLFLTDAFEDHVEHIFMEPWC